MQTDLEDQIQSNTQLLAENSSKILELKATEEELDAAREEVIKVKKVLTFLNLSYSTFWHPTISEEDKDEEEEKEPLDSSNLFDCLGQ